MELSKKLIDALLILSGILVIAGGGLILIGMGINLIYNI